MFNGSRISNALLKDLKKMLSEERPIVDSLKKMASKTTDPEPINELIKKYKDFFSKEEIATLKKQSGQTKKKIINFFKK